MTHKGASADGGHYIGWVKKDAIESSYSSSASSKPSYDDPKDEWFKFDDDKVSMVKQDKIGMLDGGGEDSTAYILLYRYVCRMIVYRSERARKLLMRYLGVRASHNDCCNIAKKCKHNHNASHPTSLQTLIGSSPFVPAFLIVFHRIAQLWLTW